MTIKKSLIVSSLIAAAAFVFVSPAQAATTCTPIYGGGQNCVTTGNLLVNKKVQNPQTNAFVDNLGVNDPRFAPNQNVPFEITVTNTGGSTIGQVSLNDTLPQFTFLADGNTSMTVKDLQPNESRKVMLVAKTVDGSQLPVSQGIMCVVNQVTATANDNQSSQDNAQFCIEKALPAPAVVTQPGQAQPAAPAPVVTQPGVTKGGLKVFPPAPAQKTPATGPEALALFGLIPSGALGFFLRRKSR